MSWLSGWTYRKEITVTNANADYQTKVLVGESSGATGEEVDCGGHVAADFDDLRFTAADGTTLLDYWIESITGSTPNGLATVWVQNNATPDTTIYMYYGGTETAVSNGANTFVAFDNFEWGNDGDDIDTSGGSVTWTKTVAGTSVADIDTAQKYSGTRSLLLYRDGSNNLQAQAAAALGTDVAIRFRTRKEDTARNLWFARVTANHCIWVEAQADEDIIYYDTANRDTGVNAAVNTWELVELNNYDGSTYDIWFNGSKIKASAGIRTDLGGENLVCFGNYAGTSSAWIDDFIVRKWAATEPSFAFGFEQEADWVSPTGHVDPDTAWTNEANAYDDDTATYASGLAPTSNVWTPYLELTVGSMSCDSVRFWALYAAASINQISVDVYYGGWHNIYEGTYASLAWVEKAIGSTQTVTAARVKFYNDDDLASANAHLHEFGFHEVVITTYYQGTGDGAITPVGLLSLKIMITMGQGAVTPTSTLNRFIKLITGQGAITPTGILNRVIKLLVGEGAITPTGTLTAVIKFFQNVGQGAITAVGSLGLKIKLLVGSGAITPSSTLNRIIKLLVGAGAITPTGTLTPIKKIFQNVGQGTITAIGALNLKIKLTVGAGAITATGALNRFIKLAVGSGEITPVGALTLKFLVRVGQGAVTIAGALNRKIKLTVGQGVITPVGTILWEMLRTLRLKVTEGHVYRMAVNEGNAYRLKVTEGRIYRMITSSGFIYRLKTVAGKIYRMVKKEG